MERCLSGVSSVSVRGNLSGRYYQSFFQEKCECLRIEITAKRSRRKGEVRKVDGGGINGMWQEKDMKMLVIILA